jgi:formylglycine-generating enzyme required for sulfatase activity
MMQFIRRRWLTVVGPCLLLCGCQRATPPVSPTAVPDEKPLAEEITNSIGMKLKLIPAGRFVMGSPIHEKDRSDDEAQHTVEITRRFYLGVYPVTKGQFGAFVKDAGYQTQNEKSALGPPFGPWQRPFADYVPTDDDPVVCVSWNEAVKFCEWLSKKEKKTYELPTEAQWEYACRAGTTTAYSFGDDPKDLGDFGWFFDNSGGHTHPVSGKKPNPWGLYDMHGGIFQWCTDFYDKGYYGKGPAKDPQNLDKADSRVVRGGCWHAISRLCRSANRNWSKQDVSTYDFGFRVVLVPD